LGFDAQTSVSHNSIFLFSVRLYSCRTVSGLRISNFPEVYSPWGEGGLSVPFDAETTKSDGQDDDIKD
jgi:hypothetical protein